MTVKLLLILTNFRSQIFVFRNLQDGYIPIRCQSKDIQFSRGIEYFNYQITSCIRLLTVKKCQEKFQDLLG